MSDDAGSYYIGNAIFVLTVCLIPAAMGIGIVRHHLYDVDKLLSRTIAYGLLLVAATALYLASVAVFAGVLASRSRSPAVLAVATTAVAVVALHPLRRRLVAWADRRVYGTRTEPAEMMADVAAELAAYRSPEDGVTGLAEAARRATRARGAVVRIELPDGHGHVVDGRRCLGRRCQDVCVDARRRCSGRLHHGGRPFPPQRRAHAALQAGSSRRAGGRRHADHR